MDFHAQNISFPILELFRTGAIQKITLDTSD